MTGGSRDTTVSGLPAADLVRIIGLCRGWFLSPDGLLAAGGQDPHSPERIAVHRAALVEAVRRISG